MKFTFGLYLKIMTNKNTSKVTREIIIGLTGGIGVEFENVIRALQAEFLKIHAESHVIRLSELIKKIPYDKEEPNNRDEPKRIKYFMNKASHLRKDFERNSLLAILAMVEIYKLRNDQDKPHDHKTQNRYSIYILNSLKRPEEAELLRNVYGRNFLLIGIQTSKKKESKI